MKKNQNRKSAAGFSLIEIIVIISIIGFLSSIVLVASKNASIRGRDARRMADIRQMDSAIQAYIADNGHAPYLGSLRCNLTNLGDNSCHANEVNVFGWQELEKDLKPYISRLPKDPCGINCYERYYSRQYFSYLYDAPSTAMTYCSNNGLDCSETNVAVMYKVGAENLEATPGEFGADRTFFGSFSNF